MMLKGNSEPTDNGSHQTMRSDSELGDKEESKLEISMFSRRQMRVQTLRGATERRTHFSKAGRKGFGTDGPDCIDLSSSFFCNSEGNNYWVSGAVS